MALREKGRLNHSLEHAESFSDGYALQVLQDLKSKDKAATLQDTNMVDLTKSIEDMFPVPEELAVFEVGQANVSGPSLVKELANHSIQWVNGKLQRGNASITKASPNLTKVEAAKKRSIEEATPSLPMASFALAEPAATVKNKTETKFPGNATEEAAWEKRRNALEAEVKLLKERFANVSKMVASSKAQVGSHNIAAARFSNLTEVQQHTESKEIVFQFKAPALRQTASNVSPPKKAVRMLALRSAV